MGQHNCLVDGLNDECAARGIAFLARKKDPAYKAQEQDFGSVVLDSLMRYVSPQRVWRTDFDWRTESYEAFCKRIGFARSLLCAVFSSRQRVERGNPFKGTLTLSSDAL